MRTTLTIEEDVAVALERLRKKHDVGLKELVNDLLRRGINEMARPTRREQLPTKSVSLGRMRLATLDNIAESLATAEGEGFK